MADITLHPTKSLQIQRKIPMTAITIDDTGRLEIPLEIRQQLGLTTKQSLTLKILNGCIILQPVGQQPKVHRLGSALVLETPPLGNMENLIDEIREDRIQKTLY